MDKVHFYQFSQDLKFHTSRVEGKNSENSAVQHLIPIQLMIWTFYY